MSAAVELIPAADAGPDNPAWHEARRQGVSASEIAAVLGISPYDSPFSLYWSKMNDWRWDGNEYASTGSHLEDAIADWWAADCDPLENLAVRPAGLYASADRPWQLATPDRLIYLACDSCDGRGGAGLEPCADCMCAGYKPDHLAALLECKWVAQSWDGWGEPGTDDVPVYYRAQALWQLDVLGVDEVHFAVLGPSGFRAYGPIRRDEKDLQIMRAAGKAFHQRLLAGDAPDVDSHSATISALKRVHPSLGQGDVEVPLELAEGYRRARALRTRVEQVVDRYEARIRAALGDDFNRAVVGKKLVASRSVYERRATDEDELYALDDGWPTTDRLNPGRAASYV